MTDSVKPKWQLILGLLPSLNTAIVAVVTAVVSIGATLVTQRYIAPAKPIIPAADVPKPVPVVAAPVARLADLGDINTKLNTLLERVPVKADPAPVAAPAEKPKPKKAKKKRDNGWFFSNWKLSI
jgi:hypothetical protein